MAPTDVAISPDGKNVYVSSQDSNAITIFDRDPATGMLIQKQGVAGCISEAGSGRGCQTGEALKFPRAVVASPDGHRVYVASGGSNAVTIFDRDPATGTLTQKQGMDGCISEGGSEGACRKGRGLGFPFDAVVSPDGKNVYVASEQPGAVAIFDRDRKTGTLAQKKGGVAFHCAGGRDRSGQISILVLALAGVLEEEIVADYLLSHERLPALYTARGEEDQTPMLEGFLRENGTSAAAEIERLLADDLETILGAGGLTQRDISALRDQVL